MQRNWTDWLAQHLAKPKPLYRYARKPGSNMGIPTEETLDIERARKLLLITAEQQNLPRNSKVLATAQEMMTARVARWQTYWGETPDDAAEQALHLLARKAKAVAPPPPHSLERIKRVCAQGDPHTALGYDGWRPRDWASLPTDGLQMLANILEEVEASLAWPDPVLQNVVCFIGKSPTEEAERPITLTSGLYRLWAVLTKSAIQRWEDDTQGFWDKAIRGSSALRAAVLREFAHELGACLGTTSATLQLDLEKIFDTINVATLVTKALALQFPPRELYLTLQVHTAARVLRAEGHHSPALLTQRSIIAGCGRSIAFTRALLHEVLDRYHRQFIPVTRLQSWVDDITALAIGTAQQVRKHFARATIWLLDQLRALGLRISPKTTVVASSSQLAKQLVNSMAQAGLRVQPSAETP